MPRLMVVSAGFLLFLLLAIWFTPQDQPNQPLFVVQQTKPSPGLTYPGFIDKTIELGFHTEHRQRDEKISGLDQVSGAGACILDYDQDGWKDVLIIAGSGIGHYFGKPKWWQANTGVVLYRNLEGQGFEPQKDIVPNRQRWGLDCLAEDFDNDGDPDLFLSNKGVNELFENDNGSFKQVSPEQFLDQKLWTHKTIAEDFDQDGLTDLYLVNYVDYSPDKRYLEQASGYKGTEEALFEPQLFEPQLNQLLRNKGQMQFEDVTEASDTKDISGRGVYGLWADINHDTLPDLLVSNDAGSPGKLFLNQGKGAFIDSSTIYGVASSESQRVMKSASTDKSTTLWIGGNRQSSVSILDIDSSEAVRERTNTGDLSDRTESTQDIGIGDFNQDGFDDLYLANGLLLPDMDSPSHAQGQTNRLLLGSPGGGYADCGTACFGDKLHPISSRTVLIEDFDRDGDLDIFETANNDLVRYLENQTVLNKKRPQTSRLSVQLPKSRLILTSWLIKDGHLGIAIDELDQLINTRDIEESISLPALQQLAHIKKPTALGPLIKALRHSSPTIRKMAVLALKEQEVDYTGRYLIPLLKDSSKEVRCAVADSLSHFYDEEEAMIRSKYLAISPLVKTTSELAPNVPPCLIHALGKTENYRALPLLIELEQSHDQETQAAALIALGLLKEQQADTLLSNLIEDKDTPKILKQSAQVALSLSSETSSQKPSVHSAQSQSLIKSTVKLSVCEGDSRQINTYQKADPKEKRRLRATLLDINKPAQKRLSILNAFTSKPLLSEYRLAQKIYQNEQDPIRFCSASVLMAYAPEKHIDTLEKDMNSSKFEEGRLIIASAIRQHHSKPVWNSFLKEPHEKK